MYLPQKWRVLLERNSIFELCSSICNENSLMHKCDFHTSNIFFRITHIKCDRSVDMIAMGGGDTHYKLANENTFWFLSVFLTFSFFWVYFATTKKRTHWFERSVASPYSNECPFFSDRFSTLVYHNHTSMDHRIWERLRQPLRLDFQYQYKPHNSHTPPLLPLQQINSMSIK